MTKLEQLKEEMDKAREASIAVDLAWYQSTNDCWTDDWAEAEGAAWVKYEHAKTAYKVELK